MDPEITTQPKLTPESQPKLGPAHKINWSVVIGALAVLTVIIFIAENWLFTKNGSIPAIVENQNIISTNDSNGILQTYYYTIKNLPANTHYEIFRVSPNLDSTDTKTHAFDVVGRGRYLITDSWKEGTVVFMSTYGRQAVIYSIDMYASSSQPETLLTIPLDIDNGESIGDIRFIDGGTAVAFVTYEGKNARAENSVLNIISLTNQEKQEKYPLTAESPLYAGFHFLATTIDNRIVYLDERGGDAGAVWSQWYLVNRDSQKFKELENLPPIAKGEENPTSYSFNPDGTKLAYIDFSAVVDSADLDSEYRDGYYGRCLSSDYTANYNVDLLKKYKSLGGTVMIQDLITNKSEEIFRNLSYQDNFCKNVGNRIISLKWLDNSNIVFETIEGIYALDIDTKQKQTLFTFGNVYSPGEQTRPEILSVQLPFVILSDKSIVQTGTNKRLEFVSMDAQKGHFFVLD